MPTPRCTDPAHKGHSYFVGGVMDGDVHHHFHAHSSDYPLYFGTILREGTRDWYEIDHEISESTEVFYFFIGQGKDYPSKPIVY